MEITNIVNGIKKLSPSVLSPIGTLIIPLIPKSLLNHYSEGKMTLSILKNNETIFDELIINLNKRMKEENEKVLKEEDPFNAVQIQEQINLSQKYIRYIATLKHSLKYIDETPDLENKKESSLDDTSPSWFSMFYDLSSRMNEEWRIELLSKCIALEDKEPSSISLRTLWNIGILETQIFNAYALYLDSSIDLDGYPIITLERDELTLNIENKEGDFHGVLIHMITGLIDWGLIQYGDFVLPSSEPITITSGKKECKIINTHQKNKETTLMRFTGYHCTDLGLDLYRIYEPRYNDISEMNYKALYELLEPIENIIIEDIK